MMPRLKDGLSCEALLRSCRDVALHQTVVVLLLTNNCAGRVSQVIGPPQPVEAAVGDDVILPCHLQPAISALTITFEWTRPDMKPRFVHVWRSGENLMGLQNPAFNRRTSLSTEQLKSGDISLKLSKVRPSDEGRYRCFLPEAERETFVELVVGAVATSFTVGFDRTSDGLVLQCDSAGWYPEPEVFWLDGEGNLLSAGPPETVRGPDDLYTVSSRVTVEKRHSNSFTCRVTQKKTNQARNIQIRVPEDVFMQPSWCTVSMIVVSTVVCLLLLSGLVFIFWKRKQNRGPDTGGQRRRDEIDLQSHPTERAEMTNHLQPDLTDREEVTNKDTDSDSDSLYLDPL